MSRHLAKSRITVYVLTSVTVFDLDGTELDIPT